MRAQQGDYGRKQKKVLQILQPEEKPSTGFVVRVPTSERFIFPSKSALQTSFLLLHSSFKQETWSTLLLILEANQSVQPAKLAFKVSLDEQVLGPCIQIVRSWIHLNCSPMQIQNRGRERRGCVAWASSLGSNNKDGNYRKAGGGNHNKFPQ